MKQRISWLRSVVAALYAGILFLGGTQVGVRFFHIDLTLAALLYFAGVSILIGAVGGVLFTDMPTPPAPKNGALPTKDDA